MPIASEVRRPQVLPPNASRWMWDSSLALYLPLWHPLTAKSPFTSMDKNATSYTVTGAVWTSQGRDFDGIDDKIALPAAVYQAFANTADFTISVWCNIDGVSDGYVYWHSGNVASNQPQISIYPAAARTVTVTVRQTAGDSVQNTYTSAAQTAGWHKITLKWSSALNRVYLNIDGVAIGSDATNVLTFAGSDFGVGNIGFGRVSGGCSTVIGEVRDYTRLLSDAEDMRNYQATKWRYR